MKKKITKKITAKEKKRLPIIFPIDLKTFAEKGELPREIQILPIGKWNHPSYGPIIITREHLEKFKENFDKRVRNDIPVTEGHEVLDEKPAVGWFEEVIVKGGNGLYAIMDWTKKGKTLLSERYYKYFSPEFYSEYEDPETREIHENVLVGGALTNKPYFKELEAVVLSENIINNKLKFNDMTLEEILAKKVEELSAEEKTFLQANKEELNEEQLATFGSVFEDEKTDEEKTAREEKEAGDANEAKGLNRDGSVKEPEDPKDPVDPDPEPEPEPSPEPKEPVEASEFKMNEKGEVIMTSEQAKILTSKANAGYEANKKLEMSEVKIMSDKLTCSEKNSEGKILPKDSEKVFSFMLELTEAQRKTFAELVNSIPSSQLFSEKGSGQVSEGSAVKEIELKVKTMMSEDKALSYSEAVITVCKENKELADRYVKEL